MKLLVLADASGVARWKRDCIELLRADHDVVVRTAGTCARGGAATVAAIAGGKQLQRASAVQNGDSAGSFDALLDLRTDVGYPGDAPDCERWFFCDGDGRPLGDLPGSNAIADGSNTFTIELRARDTDGRSYALRTGRFKSLYFYHRSMDVAMRECSRWPAIYAGVCDALGRPPERLEAGPLQPASRFRAWRFAVNIARGLWRHAFLNLVTDARWKVGIVEGSPERFLRTDYRPAIRWLPRSQSDFLADPFVFERGDRTYILGEALDPATRNGFIRCVEFDRSGSILEDRVVLQTATHLSYPFTFQDDGVWYLVPESAQERNIVLYRAVDAPYRWERIAVLIDDVAACDSTIVRRDGRWWLFFTDKARDVNLNLFAYHADELTGPWRPHTANPIKTDIRSARSAGVPFEHEGHLYRPGQDCAASYGNAISFGRIATLTPHEYREEPVRTFDSTGIGEGVDGTHTISFAHGVVAIDARETIVASPRLVVARVARQASRLILAARPKRTDSKTTTLRGSSLQKARRAI